MAEDGKDAISIEQFLLVDIRVGTVTDARANERARKPALRLEIDFGPEIGVKTSSAQIAELYDPAALVGRQVIAVVNFPARQVAGVRSGVLVLGFSDDDGRVVLIGPERPVPNGARLH